jgi:hypothetical protein
MPIVPAKAGALSAGAFRRLAYCGELRPARDWLSCTLLLLRQAPQRREGLVHVRGCMVGRDLESDLLVSPWHNRVVESRRENSHEQSSGAGSG